MNSMKYKETACLLRSSEFWGISPGPSCSEVTVLHTNFFKAFKKTQDALTLTNKHGQH